LDAAPRRGGPERSGGRGAVAGREQSHPLRHFFCELFLRLESLGLFPTAKFWGFRGTDHDQPRVICPCIYSRNCGASIGHCGACNGSSFHRFFDRVNIGVCCSVEPRSVHAQHHLHTMAVLLRDPQQILPQHELPRHGGMPRVLGPAPPNIECFGTLALVHAALFCGLVTTLSCTRGWATQLDLPNQTLHPAPLK
jgi:hypothetical protein